MLSAVNIMASVQRGASEARGREQDRLPHLSECWGYTILWPGKQALQPHCETVPTEMSPEVCPVGWSLFFFLFFFCGINLGTKFCMEAIVQLSGSFSRFWQ